MSLPLPDDAAAMATRHRLATIDIGVAAPTIAALGTLAEAVVFVAAVQGSAYPRPLLSTRVVLLTGSHAGGVVAGPAPDPKNAIPLQHLAVTVGAGIVTLEWQPAAAAIELEDAITPDQMDAALQAGWDEAERAADEGIELLVLAAGGAGAASAATAVVAAVTGVEAPVLLARVVTPTGRYDDNAWMTRCVALRDALHRVRHRTGDASTVLTALGGADIAAATGLILGAAYRRTPVMIDGPVGAAAALLANDFAPQSRSWVLLPDTGRHPTVRLTAEALGLRPWLDLALDLGEGAAALAALPMLQTALTLASVGEPVEDQPLTRYDASGNQVFVGIAKPVEPPADELAADSDTGDVGALDVAGDGGDGPTADAAAPEPDAGSDPAGDTAGTTTAADAPAIDGTAVDATVADATVVDATVVDATVVDAIAIDVTPVDAVVAETASTAEDAPVDAPLDDTSTKTVGTPSAESTGDEAPAGPTSGSADAEPAKTAPRTSARPAKSTPTKPDTPKGTPTRTVTKAPPAKTAGSKPGHTKTIAMKNVPARATDDAADTVVFDRADGSDGPGSAADRTAKTDSPDQAGAGEPVVAAPRPRKRS
jgi:NaMN:DMB phosphoribosyltransferase